MRQKTQMSLGQLREAVVDLVLRGKLFWCYEFVEKRTTVIRSRRPANTGIDEVVYRVMCQFCAEKNLFDEYELMEDPEPAAERVVLAVLKEATKRCPDWFEAPRRNGRLVTKLVSALSDALRAGEGEEDVDRILVRIREEVEQEDHC